MSDETKRVCVISFDFKQKKEKSQARKTRFFRELYGYSQQVKQQLKDGQVIIRNYHYPGVLDQIPHIKLGRSVLAVNPGDENTIINLLRKFDEVLFYNFIGWLPANLWSKESNEDSKVSKLITTYGFHSILIQIQQHGGTSQYSDLLDAGYDMEYIRKATQYLTTKELIVRDNDNLVLSLKGKQILSQVI
jgi:hypothetical protein